jgi:hypothetical protein
VTVDLILAELVAFVNSVGMVGRHRPSDPRALYYRMVPRGYEVALSAQRD